MHETRLPLIVRFLRPKGLLSGFIAVSVDASILEVGEQWAPRAWTIGDHANAGWELYFQTRGSSEWWCGGVRHVVPEGGYYLVSPGVRHRLLQFEDAETHYRFVVFRGVGGGVTESWPEGFRAGGGAVGLEIPFRGLIREVGMEDGPRARGLRAYVEALCVEVDRLLADEPPAVAARGCHRASLRAQEAMEGALGERWTSVELARVTGVSVPHLIEVFRRDFGQTPRQYLLRRRLEEAAVLLRDTDRTVTAIAHELGFCSGQHFATALRRRRGVTARGLRVAVTAAAGPGRG